MRRVGGHPPADPSRPSRRPPPAITGPTGQGCEVPSSVAHPPPPSGSPQPAVARGRRSYSRPLRRTPGVALISDESGSTFRLQLLGNALPKRHGLFYGGLGLTASCQPLRAIECSHTRIKLQHVAARD